jgi:hypothetical protein
VPAVDPFTQPRAERGEALAATNGLRRADDRVGRRGWDGTVVRPAGVEFTVLFEAQTTSRIMSRGGLRRCCACRGTG